MSDINFDSSSVERPGRFVSDNCDDLVSEVVGNMPPRPAPAHLVPFLIAERKKIADWQAIQKAQQGAKNQGEKPKDDKGGEQAQS